MLPQYMRVLRWKYSTETREASRNNLGLADAGKPLFFHHIPRTAGTSLIEGIRMMICPELAVCDNGNLPRPYVDALVPEGSRRDILYSATQGLAPRQRCGGKPKSLRCCANRARMPSRTFSIQAPHDGGSCRHTRFEPRRLPFAAGQCRAGREFWPYRATRFREALMVDAPPSNISNLC